MKGIVRKRLVALLSMAGLAGSAAPATGQVLKGSQPSNKTKAESSLKYGKAQQENNAAASGAAKKERKADGEQQAAQDVVNEKVGADQIVHKHIAGVKYEKQASSDAASKDAAKMTKVRNESTATQDSQIKKAKAGAAESSAAENDAGKKHRKAGAEQDALTVKQKVVENATGQRKAGGTQQENAAAAQATKKMDQASPGKKMNQASPK
jgi:hypothetical protein